MRLLLALNDGLTPSFRASSNLIRRALSSSGSLSEPREKNIGNEAGQAKAFRSLSVWLNVGTKCYR